MTSLRAAADRLVKELGDTNGEHVELSSSSLGDVYEIAQAYLAQHPADDEEPIDLPVLLDLGFVRYQDLDGVMKRWPVRCASKVMGGWQVRVGDIPLPYIQTRGQLRRLCSALGIELKEVGGG